MSGKTRKRWLIAGLTAVIVIAAVTGVVLFMFRDRATPVETGEVGSTLVAGSGAPGDFGLYTYATAGFETTDALTGARHEYPAQTLITIQPGGCGTLVRWQPLQERWEEWDFCPDGSLAGWQSFRRWFGVSNLDTYTCSPPVPTGGDPGRSWGGTCIREAGGNIGAAEHTVGYEVIGPETLAVGTGSIEALHLQITITGRGGSESQHLTDLWLVPGTQLPIRRVTEHTSVSQSRIGAVHYHEQYELNLISLQPSS